MAENTEKQQSWGENSIWAPLFFCVFLTIMGSFFWLHFALIPLYQVMRSSSWIPCPAVVTFSGVSLDGHARKVVVEYDYFWNDQKWQGHRYDFFLSRFEIRGGAAPDRKKILKFYYPGREIECWVEPNKPSEAVISRQVPWQIWPGILIPVFFIAAGINSGRAALRNIRKKFKTQGGSNIL